MRHGRIDNNLVNCELDCVENSSDIFQSIRINYNLVILINDRCKYMKAGLRPLHRAKTDFGRCKSVMGENFLRTS